MDPMGFEFMEDSPSQTNSNIPAKQETASFDVEDFSLQEKSSPMASALQTRRSLSEIPSVWLCMSRSDEYLSFAHGAFLWKEKLQPTELQAHNSWRN
jgi:hypothetical protein